MLDTHTYELLNRQAPAALSLDYEVDSNTSDSYRFIDTCSVVERLLDRDFYVSSATQVRGRINSSTSGKHMLRFRQNLYKGRTLEPKQVIPEIILFNGHDGKTALKFYAGFFRVICSNGLIASTGPGDVYRRVHIGHAKEDSDFAIDSIIRKFPEHMDNVERMQHTNIPRLDRWNFFYDAALLRWKEPDNYDVLISKTKRLEDQDSTVWSAYQVAQDNLIKGTSGIRPIKSIDRDVKINTGLWNLALEYTNSLETADAA